MCRNTLPYFCHMLSRRNRDQIVSRRLWGRARRLYRSGQIVLQYWWAFTHIAWSFTLCSIAPESALTQHLETWRTRSNRFLWFGKCYSLESAKQSLCDSVYSTCSTWCSNFPLHSKYLMTFYSFCNSYEFRDPPRSGKGLWLPMIWQGGSCYHKTASRQDQIP